MCSQILRNGLHKNFSFVLSATSLGFDPCPTEEITPCRRQGGSTNGLLLLESVRQIISSEYQQLKMLQLLTNQTVTLPEISASISRRQKPHICILAVLVPCPEKKKKDYKLSTKVSYMIIKCRHFGVLRRNTLNYHSSVNVAGFRYTPFHWGWTDHHTLLVLTLLCSSSHASKAGNGCRNQSTAPHFKVFLMCSTVEEGLSSSDESAVEF